MRKWRVNLVNSYDFTRGILKGFGVGGAVRWRDKASVGLPLITRPDGSRAQDIDHPFYDNGLTDIDGWLSYKTKLWQDKVRARFQLNARNLLDRRELLPQKADTTGVNRLFALQNPRQLILSATFDL